MKNLIRLFVSSTFLFYACSSPLTTTNTQETSTPKVAEINGEAIYQDELISYYEQGAANKDSLSEEALREFLPIYLNYRLKLTAAKEAGYESSQEILSDKKSFEEQLAYPLWINGEIENRLLDELVIRSKEQLKVGHVLISLPENAGYDDTLRTYNRLVEVRSKLLDGTISKQRAIDQYSSRRQGRPMGGELGWVSAGWAVKPFEDAIYATKEGDISLPFRTSFGYHIAWIDQIQEKPADRKFSHIFFSTSADSLDIANALQRADSVFSLLKNGHEWDSLAVRFNEDSRSINKGGDIGWVDWNRGLRSQFTDSVMAMNQLGQVRPPFYSSYGVHIVRLDSIREKTSNDEVRDYFIARKTQLNRFKDQKGAVIAEVKKQAESKTWSSNHEQFKAFVQAKNYQYTDNITAPDSLAKRPIYQIGTVTRNVGDFASWVRSQKPGFRALESLDSGFEEFKDIAVQEYVVPFTKQKFPEMAEKTRRYVDGLLVYKVTEDSVWTPVRTDSVALKTWLNRNSGEYMLDKRWSFARVGSYTDTLLQRAKQEISDGVAVDSVRKHFPQHAWEIGEIEDLNIAPFEYLKDIQPGDFSEPFEYRGRKNVIYLRDILPARPMTFDEAYHRLVADYQKVAEEKWLDRLADKYSVVSYLDRIQLE